MTESQFFKIKFDYKQCPSKGLKGLRSNFGGGTTDIPKLYEKENGRKL